MTSLDAEIKESRANIFQILSDQGKIYLDEVNARIAFYTKLIEITKQEMPSERELLADLEHNRSALIMSGKAIQGLAQN